MLGIRCVHHRLWVCEPDGETEAETPSHTGEEGPRWAPEQVCLTPLPVALSTTRVLQASLTPKAKRHSSPGLPGLFKPQEAARGQVRA